MTHNGEVDYFFHYGPCRVGMITDVFSECRCIADLITRVAATHVYFIITGENYVENRNCNIKLYLLTWDLRGK